MKKTRGGFTLIELSLSMVFIGILSVLVVLLIQNTTSSYRRGLVLNQLNTIGMDLIDDVRSSIQGANTDALDKMCERLYLGDSGNLKDCEDDNGNSFVSVTKYGKVEIGGVSIGDDIPVYGAFCTGTYTYIWNSGYFEQGDGAEERKVFIGGAEAGPAILVTSDGSVVAKGFRLLKIYDRNRTVCKNSNLADTSKGYQVVPTDKTTTEFSNYNTDAVSGGKFVIDVSMLVSPSKSENSYTIDDSDKNMEGGVEVLKGNITNDLVLYDFYMTKPAISETRKNLFFAGSFILGTRRGGVDITVSGNSCKPPTDEFSDLEYCAINKFNFAVQAGGN